MRRLLSHTITLFKTSRLSRLFGIVWVQIISATYLLRIPLSDLISLKFFILLVATAMTAGAGYIINDYYDRKIDLINRPEGVIVGISFRPRRALATHFFLNLLAVGLGVYISNLIALLIFIFAFSLWFYSNYLRRLVLVGNVLVALMHAGIMVLITIYFEETNNLIWIYTLFAFLIVLIKEVVKDLSGVKGYANFGVETIPVKWGIRGAKMTIYIFSILAIGALTFFLMSGVNLAALYYFICLFPLFGWFLYKCNIADTQSEYRYLYKVINWIMLSGVISIFLLYE